MAQNGGQDTDMTMNMNLGISTGGVVDGVIYVNSKGSRRVDGKGSDASGKYRPGLRSGRRLKRVSSQG